MLANRDMIDISRYDDFDTLSHTYLMDRIITYNVLSLANWEGPRDMLLKEIEPAEISFGLRSVKPYPVYT